MQKQTHMKSGFNSVYNLNRYYDRYEAYRKALEYIAYYGLGSQDPVAIKQREVARNTLEKH